VRFGQAPRAVADRTTPARVTQAFTVPRPAVVPPSAMVARSTLAGSAPVAGPVALMARAASATTMAGDGSRIDRFIMFSLRRSVRSTVRQGGRAVSVIRRRTSSGSASGPVALGRVGDSVGRTGASPTPAS
jgi:hypothetical protein